VIPAVDFAVLPPEVNSGRMYSGAGSGPMLAAASAWNALAAELHSTALSYGAVLEELTTEKWQGPASAVMAAAALPYVAWMNTTAAQAEQTAAQAEAAAAAYEAAFTATVPPPEIAANRAQLMMLIATNILGQNTPAIAATEAQYAQMWAQDATAMYAYAGSCALATELTSFTEPQHSASPSGLTAQSAAVAQAAATPAGTGHSTLSAVPSALHGLATPTSTGSGLGALLDDLGLDIFSPTSGSSTGGLAGLLNVISDANGSAFGNFLNDQFLNSIFASGFFMPARFLGNAVDFMAMNGQSAPQGAAAVLGPTADALDGPLGSIGTLGNTVSASIGQANLVGPLSVPPNWTPPTPLHNPLSAAFGQTPTQAPPVATGTPPFPLAANMGRQGLDRAIPQYGFKPMFVAHPPAAG
jgi:PPE-repeat protein